MEGHYEERASSFAKSSIDNNSEFRPFDDVCNDSQTYLWNLSGADREVFPKNEEGVLNRN